MDFVADQLVDGTRFRALTIVDVYTREALDIVVGQRLRAEQVVETCNRIVAKRGGSGFSDTGVSGFLLGHRSGRREEVHEEAKT